MRAAEAILAARAAGADIAVNGEKLVIRARAGSLPASVLAEIRAHRREALALLRAEARPAAEGLLFYSCHFCAGEGEGCTFCRGTGTKACPRCLGQGLDCGAPCRGTGRMVIETGFDREVDELRRVRALLVPQR